MPNEHLEVIDLSKRNEGCTALVHDNGVEQWLPVCLGGLTLEGCNNPEQCLTEYKKRAIANHQANPQKQTTPVRISIKNGRISNVYAVGSQQGQEIGDVQYWPD
jgi:hypothetical protein